LVEQVSRTTRHESVTPEGRRLRTDIQALRAFAVVSVVIYHLWSKRLPGGFVGVDIFFVISGYLITSHLLRHPPRTRVDFGAFWARRIRRLLPAALLVLAVTLAGSRLFGPQTQWSKTAHDVVAAAFYVSNWVFAADSVDYLAAEAAPSPVQHFWSLSVEEQFYFVWPLIIAILALIATRTGRRFVIGAGIAAAVAASLVWSIHETSVNPAAAYFVTPTRMWELGAGGLLAAVWSSRGARQFRSSAVSVRSVVALACVAAAVWSMFAYSGSVPFPGWRAVVPVAATVGLIAVQLDRGDGPLGWLAALPPIQWLGRISYSIYLWHWVLFVFAADYLGHVLDWRDKLVVIAATLALAHLTVVLVEDRFRVAGRGVRLRFVYLAAATAMVVVLGAAHLQQTEVTKLVSADQHELTMAVKHSSKCFGAGALASSSKGSCPAVDINDIVPSPLVAAGDKSNAYPDVSHGKDCWSYTPAYPQVTCTFGAKGGGRRVELVGNSHAGEWLPALEVLADRYDWRITTRLASRCSLAMIPQSLPTAAESRTCLRWTRQAVRAVIADHPDVVVMSNRISVSAVGKSGKASVNAYRRGYLKVLGEFKRAGVDVLVIHDTPAPGDAGITSAPDCVAENPHDLSACSGPARSWIPADPAPAAARSMGTSRIRAVDLNNWICPPKRCESVVGGVIVYFDGSHLTATYARTIAPHLATPLRAMLAGS